MSVSSSQRSRVREELDVFRFVASGDPSSQQLFLEFRSDKSRGKRPRGRSLQVPELQDGMSVFRTLDLARRRWTDIAVSVRRRNPSSRLTIGQFIARVRLPANAGMFLEDLGAVDGHMTLWGDAEKLANCVIEIVNAEE